MTESKVPTLAILAVAGLALVFFATGFNGLIIVSTALVFSLVLYARSTSPLDANTFDSTDLAPDLALDLTEPTVEATPAPDGQNGLVAPTVEPDTAAPADFILPPDQSETMDHAEDLAEPQPAADVVVETMAAAPAPDNSTPRAVDPAAGPTELTDEALVVLLMAQPAPTAVGDELAEPEPVVETTTRSEIVAPTAGELTAAMAQRLRQSDLLFGPGLATRLVACAVCLFLAWIYFTEIGNNPAGFFSDEAQIGLRANQWLHGTLPDGRLPIFYQHFAYSHLGALPLYATAPFIFLFGFDDISVRLASVVWSVLALVMLLGFVRACRWRYGEIGVVVFAASPIVVHISRVNIGHAPSLFCICAGFYCYARAIDHGTWGWSVLAGAAFGLSVYGHPAYYIATPVILIGLALGTSVVYRLDRKGYWPLTFTALASLICWIPVINKVLSDEHFMDRFHDKEQSTAPLLSLDRVHNVADNYSKYFSLDYLFQNGEVSFITRHSVPGAGLFPWVALLLMGAGVIASVRQRNGTVRLFGVAAIAIFLLYPLPDAITTRSDLPPDTFSTYSTLIFMPILCAIGAQWLVRFGKQFVGELYGERVVALALVALTVLGATRFYTVPYDNYPNIAADYWGWQYGPRQATDAFKNYSVIYDRFWLDGDFNEAYIFLDFYLEGDADLRARSAIGGLENADISRHDLFAVRAATFDEFMQSDSPIRRYVKVLDIIQYPNGQPDLYLVDVGVTNDHGVTDLPF